VGAIVPDKICKGGTENGKHGAVECGRGFATFAACEGMVSVDWACEEACEEGFAEGRVLQREAWSQLMFIAGQCENGCEGELSGF